MSVVSLVAARRTPALVAIFHAKIPESNLKDFRGTRVNYGGH